MARLVLLCFILACSVSGCANLGWAYVAGQCMAGSQASSCEVDGNGQCQECPGEKP
jgi:hypothetical protein